MNMDLEEATRPPNPSDPRRLNPSTTATVDPILSFAVFSASNLITADPASTTAGQNLSIGIEPYVLIQPGADILRTHRRNLSCAYAMYCGAKE